MAADGIFFADSHRHTLIYLDGCSNRHCKEHRRRSMGLSPRT